MSHFAMEAFNQIFLQYPLFVAGGVGATAIAAGGALIYRIATRYCVPVHKMSLGLGITHACLARATRLHCTFHGFQYNNHKLAVVFSTVRL